MTRSRVLAQLVAAVADRESVDWERVAAAKTAPDQARPLAALRLVDRVATDASGSRVSGRDATRTPRAPMWSFVVLTVAGLQSLLALLAPIVWTRSEYPIPASLVHVVLLAFCGGGLVLVLSGRRDARTYYLGGFFLCFASAAALRFLPVAAPLVQVAAVARFLQGLYPDAMAPWFLWQFVRRFPRVVRFETGGRIIDVATGLSLLSGGVLFVASLVVTRAQETTLAELLHPLARKTGGLYWLVLSAFLLGAPVAAWWRARRAEADERRRTRWFVSGLAIGILPLFSTVFAESVSPTIARFFAEPSHRYAQGVVLYVLLLTIPVTTGYAVLAHRILDLRFVLHRAAQHALARSVVFLLAAIPSVAVLLGLARRRHLPLSEAISSPSVLWLGTASALGWLCYANRRRLLSRLERLLVGTREDAATVLARFSKEAGECRQADELESLLERRLGEAVTAESAALVLTHGDARALRAARGHYPDLPADSGIVELARVPGGSIVVAPEVRNSIFSWLVEDDQQWVVATHACLVAPLHAPGDFFRGILVLGPTRGGAGYMPVDLRVLAAFAATTVLALERVEADPGAPMSTSRSGPAAECSACGIVSEARDGNPARNRFGRCTCGGALRPALLPACLHGKFEVERVLGRGGMGVVYQAVDLELGRSVALKTLPQQRAHAIVRMRREARSMAGFLHPNLALIFGLEAWRGIPVLIVEYLERGTLAHRLPPGLPPAEALELGAILANALAAMHARGFLHRDIKPQNIGFAADGTPKLLDFGLAHLASEAIADSEDAPCDDESLSGQRLTRTGGVVGTPLYLSPEMLRGEAPSPAQDLWGLHLVVWEAIVGCHPLARLPLRKALQQVERSGLPFDELAGSVPAPVASMLGSALHRDPRRRPSTAEEARASLLATLRLV